MRKKTTNVFIISLGLLALIFQSCKDDSYLATTPPIADQSFVEQFDTLTAAQNAGWVIANKSEPIGAGVWQQGAAFSAYSSTSTNDGCIESDASCCHDAGTFTGTISNWVISPIVIMQNDDHIIFYTKTTDATWGDRMQVRTNTNNTGINCGDGNTVGDFTNLILDINSQDASNDSANVFGIPPPYYIYDPVNAYPTNWTRFTATIKGISKPTQGRFAFRYYVPNGGDDGMGSGVLLDSVAYVSVNHQP